MTLYIYRYQGLNTTCNLIKFNSGNITLYIEKNTEHKVHADLQISIFYENNTCWQVNY